ncbi:hypothetical protein [Natranaerobius trueperi]|uniref:Uncharacterized protein n=1 Tax=Natranaerobius trueperi TaxID=759412 RepID=A0A226BV19_9FIRM|nr:hypothetical protein [Natranaerobius trueperi]OWZ82833.1 hypothetical protein CDO51_11895 [Natranaerobius trueperi]
MVPVVQTEKPQVDQFIKKQVSDYNVYFDNDIKPFDPNKEVIITLNGFWIFKSLHVKNITNFESA